MKMIKTYWLIMVFSIITIPMAAGNRFTVNGFLYEVRKDSVSLSVIDYQPSHEVDYSKPFHIPGSVAYNGRTFPVVSIGREAFRGHTELRSVIVDEGITYIGKYAFDSCVNMDSLYLPASLDSFLTPFLSDCDNLKSLVVDKDNPDLDSRDGCNAIICDDELVAGCSSTKIPTTIERIGEWAFYHCNTLERLDIPEGVETINCFAFYGCGSLKELNLPTSLRQIMGYVFDGCSSLASIFIPKNVNYLVNGNIFTWCNNLVSIEVDKENPVYDSRDNCNGIVRKADAALVDACKTTTISNNIKILADGCYAGTKVRSIYIPQSVDSINSNAFADCYDIAEIKVAPNNPIVTSPDGSNALLTKDGKKLLVGGHNTIIPNGVEEIAPCAFFGRYTKPVLLLPESVKKIGYDAFRNCNALYEVILPRSVNEVECATFSHCSNLCLVQIHSNIDTLCDTFADCPNLSVVSLPEGVKSIKGMAFANCTSLKQIFLPSTVTNIEKEAFINCPATIIKNEK